jgi:hypothetical protein
MAANNNYTNLPKGIKLSKDLKDFREYGLMFSSDPQDFEKTFQKFCKSLALAQSEKLRIAAERIN